MIKFRDTPLPGVVVLAVVGAAFSACSPHDAQPGTSGSNADAASLDATATDSPDSACLALASGLPIDVFCTGLYSNRDPNQIAAGNMPYTPGTTLWSDGAEKRRFIYLPPNSKIDTSVLDSWNFPNGTKTWKEFRISGVLIETRLMWKRDAKTWDVGTYVWDATGTSATLNTQPKGIILPSGYEIPTTKDCDKCHHGGADKVLGIEAVALALPTANGATLTALAQQGWLSLPPAKTTISLPEDATGKAGPALGYLHANCGMACHSSRGLGDETKLRLRLRAGEFWSDSGGQVGSDAGTDAGAVAPVAVDQTDIYLATVNQTPTTAAVAHAFPGANRITPGLHEKSLVWLVANVRGNYQMPPLVSHRVDDVGMAKLAAWIDALPKQTP